MTKQDKHARALSKPWLARFHRFLVEKRLVSKEKAKYFAGWVERFLQTAKADAARLAPEALSAFLDELSRQEEPWKVQQAREALRLYRYTEGTCQARRFAAGADAVERTIAELREIVSGLKAVFLGFCA